MRKGILYTAPYVAQYVLLFYLHEYVQGRAGREKEDQETTTKQHKQASNKKPKS